jgi:maleate isomerase
VASRHRIRLIVPSSNVTMETEVPALLRERERVRPQDRLPCTVRGLDAAR